MADNFFKRLCEQENMVGELRDSVLGWMQNLLQETYSAEIFRQYLTGMRIDFSQFLNPVVGKEGLDPYQVLGLEKTAKDEEVKRRYRELLMKLHPDTAGLNGTGFLIQIIITAYRQIEKERGWQ